MSGRGSRAAGAALIALLLARVASPVEPPGAIQSWLEGDSDAALAALGRQAPARERDFNQGVVLLYKGNGEAAERVFGGLRALHPAWLPASRWLAKAQQELGRREALDTASALLKMKGATGRDHFWAARLFAEANDLARARDGFRRAVAEEADLYTAWSALADCEQALGNLEAARVARQRAGALHPGGLPTEMAPAPPLPAGRTLRYQGKYLVIPIGTVTLREGGLLEVRGRPARLLTLEAKSGRAILFMHIDSRFESHVGQDGGLVSHRDASNDSATGRRQATFEADPATDSFTVRQAADGLFSYEVLKVPPEARPHDGISVIAAARAVARAKGSLSVLRIVDATWKGTPIRAARSEPINWRGRKVDTVCVEIGVSSKSAAGVTGTLRLWISADESAIPYRAKMGTGFGSVTLELMEEEGE